MDPISLILTALTTGAAVGAKDTASSAIKDTYNGFKALIRRKFGDQPKALSTLTDYEDDPETYEKPLRKVLSASRLDQDEEIVAAAGHLMTLIQPQQAAMGKYNIQNTGTIYGQVIGDNPNVTQHFGTPPPAPGKEDGRA